MKRQSLDEHEEAFRELRRLLPPGTTVYTILRRVSRTGMSRSIDLMVIRNNEPRWFTYWAAVVLGKKLTKDGGLLVHGCGMDMGFHVVYSLSARLYPDGFDCIRDRCPSNDHVNRVKSHHHSDGGYALKHRWL